VETLRTVRVVGRLPVAQNSRRTCEGRWWAVTDLNRGPSRCKRDALTAELTAQFFFIVTEERHSVNAG